MTARRAAVFVVAIGVALVAAQVPVPARPAITREELAKALDAQRKLDLAKLYLAESRFTEARKLLEEALTLDPVNLDAKGLLTRLLDSENQRLAERQRAELDEAEWQLARGNRETAVELARKVAEAAQDTQVRGRADAILERCRPDLAGEVGQLGRRVWSGWGFDLLVVALLLVLVWLAAWLVRGLYTAWAGRRTWRIRGIEDKTGLAVGDLVLAAFSRFSARQALAQPASGGLLRLEVLLLPSARELLVKLGEPKDLVKSIEGLQFKAGALEVGTVARLLLGLGRWFQSKLPSVSGVAFCADSLITVRLTATRPGRPRITVSASVEKQAGSDAARACAERAVVKACWGMVKPEARGAELDAIEALHEGLGLLRRYMAGEPSTVLWSALERFSRVRAALPEFLEACLYEGITLDLLERHDAALLRFQHVEDRAADEQLRDKARYNQAVAHMRTYRPEGLRLATELYARVTGYAPDVLQQPIKVLAKAGWANTVAHYPVHWQELLHAGRHAEDEAQLIEWKRHDIRQVFQWLQQVQRMAGEIQADLETIERSKSPAWDVWARRQLEWARHNALGNMHLTLVTGFLEEPCPPEFDTVEQDRLRFLQTALEHFRATEMILPPGAETLANLGTTHLYLGQQDQARDCLTRAIALNPDLEYAHLRLADSWEQDGQPDKVIKVLKGYRGRVATRHLQALYEKYGVPVPGEDSSEQTATA